MPIEGHNWVGGPAQAPEFGSMDFMWWKWEVKSANPCAICQKLDGTMSPTYQPKPHAFCFCDQVMRPRICAFHGRVEDSRETEEIMEEEGIVPPHGSRTFTHTSGSSSGGSVGVGGATGSVGSSELSSNSTTFNNPGDEEMIVHAVWEQTTTTYHDAWDCDGPEFEIREVQEIETRWVGFR